MNLTVWLDPDCARDFARWIRIDSGYPREFFESDIKPLERGVFVYVPTDPRREPLFVGYTPSPGIKVRMLPLRLSPEYPIGRRSGRGTDWGSSSDEAFQYDPQVLHIQGVGFDGIPVRLTEEEQARVMVALLGAGIMATPMFHAFGCSE